jgi:hypothetical protein
MLPDRLNDDSERAQLRAERLQTHELFPTSRIDSLSRQTGHLAARSSLTVSRLVYSLFFCSPWSVDDHGAFRDQPITGLYALSMYGIRIAVISSYTMPCSRGTLVQLLSLT